MIAKKSNEFIRIGIPSGSELDLLNQFISLGGIKGFVSNSAELPVRESGTLSIMCVAGG